MQPQFAPVTEAVGHPAVLSTMEILLCISSIIVARRIWIFETFATMDQATLHYCSGCKTKTSQDQFSLRQKDDKYGLKGEPTGRCTSCTMRNKQAHQNLKRKRIEEGTTPSECPDEHDTVITIEKFTALLRQQALMGDLHYRARVSTQGLAEEEEDILKIIVGHVWDATGFRFTFVVSTMGAAAHEYSRIFN